MDATKMIHNYKNSEGYINYKSFVKKTIQLMSKLHLKNEEHLYSLGKAYPHHLCISEDADLQFWAEDELSTTESKQVLMKRQKRRYSLSYRNRNKQCRNRSIIMRSSSSSLSKKKFKTIFDKNINRKKWKSYSTL